MLFLQCPYPNAYGPMVPWMQKSRRFCAMLETDAMPGAHPHWEPHGFPFLRVPHLREAGFILQARSVAIFFLTV